MLSIDLKQLTLGSSTELWVLYNNYPKCVVLIAQFGYFTIPKVCRVLVAHFGHL